jgi:hypothetical protein
MKYFKYLKYLLIHKYYVFIECFRLGIVWRGLTHDLSKFLPSEFIPYANYFYGNEEVYKEKFDYAWNLHQKRNKHHWQFWLLKEDSGAEITLEMKYIYFLEMICDWVGAGKAMGRSSPKNDRYLETRNWYEANKDKIKLHPKIRVWIECKLSAPVK